MSIRQSYPWSPTDQGAWRAQNSRSSLDSDILLFDVSELAQLAKNLQPTRRNLVSLIGKFYDPLGFLAPITIQFKILFRKLCLDWDNLLSEELIVEWKELVANLSEGGPVSIPRSYFHNIKGVTTSTTLWIL